MAACPLGTCNMVVRPGNTSIRQPPPGAQPAKVLCHEPIDLIGLRNTKAEGVTSPASHERTTNFKKAQGWSADRSVKESRYQDSRDDHDPPREPKHDQVACRLVHPSTRSSHKRFHERPTRKPLHGKVLRWTEPVLHRAERERVDAASRIHRVRMHTFARITPHCRVNLVARRAKRAVWRDENRLER